MAEVNSQVDIEEKFSDLKINSKSKTDSKLIEIDLEANAQNSCVDGKSEGEINGDARISLPSGYVFSYSKEQDECYNMNHKYRGHCVIFNHREFDHILGLGERCGTDRDRDQVSALFKLLGFEVVVHNNLTIKGIEKVLNNYAYNTDHTDYDCFALVFMSHGENGLVYGKDQQFKSEKLFNNFTADNCPSLAGKPKMFFIQACRGDKLDSGSKIVTKESRDQTDSGSYTMYTIPNHADFLTCWSTVPDEYDISFSVKDERSLSKSSVANSSSPSLEINDEEKDIESSSVECACGLLSSVDDLEEESPCKSCKGKYYFRGHFSWRNTTNGSWFIQSIVKVFSQHANNMDVLSMMTVVNRSMIISFESNCPSNKGMHGKKQTSSSVSTLMRKIYLIPKQ